MMNPRLDEMTLNEQAAYWFLCMRDDNATAEEIEAALAWQDASRENRRAFMRVEELWLFSGQLDAATIAALAPPRKFRGQSRRPRWIGGLAIAAAVLVMVSAGLLGRDLWFTGDISVENYATAIGENRSIKLADGSSITLSAASAVSVSYSKRERRITLNEGEALFEVAKDTRRPFLVEALGGRVRAVGTQFNMHRGQDGVVVTVLEGVVQVEPRQAASTDDALPATRLGAGYQISYFSDGSETSLMRVPVSLTTAWRNGSLVFVDRSLAEIVFDLNRYSHKRITVDSEQVKALRFSGMVSVKQIDDWLSGLEKTAQVRIVRTEDQVTLTHVATK